MNLVDILLIVINLAVSGFLFFLAGYAVKVISSQWRIFYIVPMIISLSFIVYGGFEISMITAYIGSLIPVIGFLYEKEKKRKLSAVFSAALIAIAVPACLLNKGYRTVDYVQDFKKGFDCMKEHYVLAEHKGIDWDGLYDEYLPMFEEADKLHDKTANYIAWKKFCAEFHDGHVGFSVTDTEVEEEEIKRIYGNDYGLSLVTLDNGKIAAVNVDEKLSSYGIKTGTVITKWDGADPLEVARKSEGFKTAVFADSENEAFYLAVFAAGVGGDTVTVSYIDENGNEKEATLKKLGNYGERAQKTIEILDGGVMAGHLAWTDIDEKTACLRIKMMMFDSESDNTGDFSKMKNGIIEKLGEYRAKGVENIVLDMRNNSGGSSDVVKVLAEIFAPEGEHYYATDGKWSDEKGIYLTDVKTGKFVEGKKNFYKGENLWGDGNVIIIVNAGSVSAADHLTRIMCDFENVTVIGFTGPNGSAQGIGGIKLESGQLIFSNALLLDENGDVFIDSGTDYKSRNKIDIKVPLDENAIEVLFTDGEDYLMKKAVDLFTLLNNQSLFLKRE